MDWLHDIIVNNIGTLLPATRNLVIFVLSYAEGLPVIGSFVPGGTVAIMIGSLSAEGFISPLLAINLIAAGSFLGDITGFLFGKTLRKIPAVRRMVESQKHEKNWDIFDRHIALVIIFGKLLPVVRSTPSLFAGARNISKWKYIFYVLIGSYLWSIAGIYGGSFLTKILGEKAIPVIIICVIGLFLGTWGVSKIRKLYKSRKSIITKE
jgi:membrane protein DedA with SNARE-associated domain